ncbi:hypothetical protein ACSBR1_032106 [Camellia fascicularis]
MRRAKNLCNYQPSSMAFSVSSTIIPHTRVSINVSLAPIQPFFSTLLPSIRSKRTCREHTVTPIRPTLGRILAKNPSMRSLYNGWVATSKLLHSIKTKRIELQLLRQNLMLYSILKGQHEDRAFVLKFSAMEIYNEAVRDLLSTDSLPLRVLDDPEKGTVVEKLTEETPRDWSHLKGLLSICEAQRKIGETTLNETSSRSHHILRLNFVDLAGSERASQALSGSERAEFYFILFYFLCFWCFC